MAHYILDSDIIDYLENGASPFHEKCVERFSTRMNEELSISILTVFEFDYRLAGCDAEQAPLLQEMKMDILKTYGILPLSLSISQRYGNLKAAFKAQSKAKPKTMRGHTVDIILAACALEHDAVVVSNDRIFPMLQTIEPKLKVENWAR